VLYVLCYPPPEESLAWTEGSDEAWAERAAAAYAAAVERGPDQAEDDGAG